MSENPSSELPIIFHRDFFPDALNKLGLIDYGAEIGVQDGIYSHTLLSKWQGKCLYSIDPWKEFDLEGYQDIANLNQDLQDFRYEGAKNLLSQHGDRSKILRMTSHEGSKQFEKEFFDFVYIDANHHYEAVVADLRLWYPKVKVGGILAGHDYMPDGMYEVGLFGVKRAVDEFASKRNLPLTVSHDNDPQSHFSTTPSWFIIKK